MDKAIKMKDIIERNKQLREENKKLRGCVEFYANEYNWISRSPTLADVIHADDIEQLEMLHNMSCNTGGWKARETLKEIGGNGE